MSMSKPPHLGLRKLSKETINEPSLDDPLEACLAQFGDDLDLDKLLEQADGILDPTPELQKLRMGKPLRYHSVTHLY